LAKEKTKKAVTAKPASARSAATAPKAKTSKTPMPKAPKTAKTAKTAKASAKVQKVVKGAKKIAKNPMATEVVAATLVAAAAALRDPKKAKALALEAADDLKKAAKSGADGGALWKLALDVARRSIDAVGKEDSAKKVKKTGGKKK
jgi:hypothetical protein